MTKTSLVSVLIIATAVVATFPDRLVPQANAENYNLLNTGAATDYDKILRANLLTQKDPTEKTTQTVVPGRVFPTSDFSVRPPLTEKFNLSSHSSLRPSPQAEKKKPFRVLDAPDLLADLPIFDWSAKNLVSIAIQDDLYVKDIDKRQISLIASNNGSEERGSFEVVKFDTAGKRLAAVDYSGVLSVWNVEESTGISENMPPSVQTLVAEEPGLGATALAWHPKREDLLAVATRDGKVAILSLLNRSVMKVFEENILLNEGVILLNEGVLGLSPTALAWSGDGRRLAVGTGSFSKATTEASAGKTVVFEFETETYVSGYRLELKKQKRVSYHHTGSVKALAWNPAFEVELATTGTDGTVWLWNLDRVSKGAQKAFDSAKEASERRYIEGDEANLSSDNLFHGPQAYSSLLWSPSGRHIFLAAWKERVLRRFSVDGFEQRRLHPSRTGDGYDVIRTGQVNDGRMSHLVSLVKGPKESGAVGTLTTAVFNDGLIEIEDGLIEMWKVPGTEDFRMASSLDGKHFFRMGSSSSFMGRRYF